MRTRQLLLPTALMLVLIGCERPIDKNSRVRNTYASKEDCLKDWNGPQDCEPNQSHGWVGPWYPYHIYQSNVGARPGYYHSPGVISEATSSFHSNATASKGISISRGGFGSTGHSFSAGS